MRQNFWTILLSRKDKDDFENYQDIEDRVIGGISFRGRTYRNIG